MPSSVRSQRTQPGTRKRRALAGGWEAGFTCLVAGRALLSQRHRWLAAQEIAKPQSPLELESKRDQPDRSKMALRTPMGWTKILSWPRSRRGPGLVQ